MKSRIAENVIALYAVQACTYLLPLITFPYLARTLGPQGWGAVLFAQSIGSMIAIAVEYGFDYSATRESAQHSGNNRKLQELVAGVLGAKLCLSSLCVMAALLARPFTQHIAPSPALFWSSVVWGVAQGINMLWYFQGQQRMRSAGILEVSGKMVATFSIFLLVHQPSDGWKVMAAQALGCIVSHGITVAIAYKEIGFCLPSFRLVWNALRIGWSLFLFRASQSLLTNVNGIVLGLFASPTALGLYAGADKLGQVSRQSLWPLNQALFPHQAQEFHNNKEAAIRNTERSMKILGGLGLCSGLVLIVGAPFLIPLALGSSFTDAVPTLRVLGLITPLSALGSVLGFQWLLPLRMDREFNYVFFVAGVFHLVVASILTAHFASVGMACAAFLSQAFIVLCFAVLYRRSRAKLLSSNEPVDMKLVA